MPRGRPAAAASEELVSLDVTVTRAGSVQVRRAGDGGEATIPATVAARILDAFADGGAVGLLHLGTDEVDTSLPPVLAYWRSFAGRFVAAVCARGETRTGEAFAPPALEVLEPIARSVPPMTGSEYVDAALLAERWQDLDAELRRQVGRSDVGAYLRARHAAWNLVGRVHFNLAENRGDDDAPFAFLATYTTRLTARATAQHVPLGQALREYAGARAKAELQALLEPVRRAAESCEWLAQMVETDEVFHPLRWTAGEAALLLADVPKLEAAGVVVRMPAAWGGRRPARVEASAVVGGKAPAGLGRDALLDFKAEVALDGEPLTKREVAELLAGSDGLRLLRGRWIELDRESLRETMKRLQQIERAAADGIGFSEAMRLLAGTPIGRGDGSADAETSPRVVAGAWLAETLAQLRSPAGLAAVEPGPALKATLRPYQAEGLRWLRLLTELGLGACLADDMGLGKTMQVIALVLASRESTARVRPPHLLVVPASLLGNWTAELERFAPSLRVLVAHPSSLPAAELAGAGPDLTGVDVVITSYGTLARAPDAKGTDAARRVRPAWLLETRWGLAIADEAQALKNPGTQQTRAAKGVLAQARVALTGTPIENRVGDLWSIFDFTSPGLLGTAKEFTAYTKRLGAAGYGPLRELIRPYVLRRLKTDRRIIADLPDKTEVTAYCGLSAKQVALYEEAVAALAASLRAADGIKRRGVVLASLVQLKQICNHPSHWIGESTWREPDSGKLQRVRAIAEVIAAKQEKLLVFTQFREACEPLAAFLAEIFGRPGLVLHGSTKVSERAALVKRFQDDETVPFFVLSLKAGGIGLNLTAASHVVHFDRWWNPAVEDQATDRAFRIGQRRNVLVHKLVVRGTLEEKVDALLAGKRTLARDLLEGTSEVPLTELDDATLLSLVALDLRQARKEDEL